MLIREGNLLKFVEQLLEFEETKQLSQLFSEKIATDNWALNGDSDASAFQWGASILLSWRNLPSCSIWSLVTPTFLFEIFIWALLSSTWMCSDMLGCLKLTLGTKYLEVCRYLQQQIQAMQEKPSTFFVGWFGYTMDPPFVVSSSSFFSAQVLY